MCVLRHQLCDDSVIHQMRLSRAKQKCALAPGALSRETSYAAYASAAASGHYRLPTLCMHKTCATSFVTAKKANQQQCVRRLFVGLTAAVRQTLCRQTLTTTIYGLFISFFFVRPIS